MKRKSFPLWPEGYSPPSWLPDWRDKEEYSRLASFTEYSFDVEYQTGTQATINTSKSEYAWEFLRRNPWYQADYQRLRALCEEGGFVERYTKPLGLNIFSIDDKPPPSADFHADLYRVLRKWGLGYYLLNPAIEIHETAAFEAVRRLGADCYQAIKVIAVPGKDNKSDKEFIPIDGGIIPGDTESFWLFDVSLPIEPQLRQARSFLEGAQKRLHGKKIQASKTDPTKYNLYLRILDADACEAEDKEIMSILFPGEDRFTYTDKHGRPYRKETTHCNPGRDLLKNHRKASYYMRDVGYRLLF